MITFDNALHCAFNLPMCRFKKMAVKSECNTYTIKPHLTINSEQLGEQ